MDALDSPDGRYRVQIQNDGNFVRWEPATGRVIPWTMPIGPDPEYVPTPDPPLPPVLPWTINGTLFRDATGLVRYRGMSAFLLFAWWRFGFPEVDQFLDVARRYGVNTLRVLGMVGWEGQAFGPDGESYYSELADFGVWLLRRGLRMEFVACADKAQTPTVAVARAHYQQCRDILVGTPHLLEVANEPWNNLPDGMRVADFAAKVPGLWQASGDYDFNANPAVGNYVTIHTARNAEWVAKAKHAIDISTLGWGGPSPTHTPVVCDEPMGIGVDVPGSRSLNAQAHGEYAAVASLYGAGSTIHSECGIFTLRAPTDSEAACMDAVLSSWDAVPLDAGRGAYSRWPMAGFPLAGADGDFLRCYGMEQPTTATCVLVQPRAGYIPTASPGWRIVDRRGPGGCVFLMERP